MNPVHRGAAGARSFRVLLVDDVATVRRLLVDALSNDPAIEVVGTAADGRIALARIPEVQPDLVVLDLEMPLMDGLETLAEVRRQWPDLPVIVFSSLTRHGAESTLRALWLGANDYVPKPSGAGVSASLVHIRTELIPRIKALCLAARHEPAPPAPMRLPMSASSADRMRPEIIAIASSTGGPRALAAVLGGLDPGFPVPIVVVQHMPPVFTRHLAEGLDGRIALPVSEAQHGDVLTPGRVLIAPGGRHTKLVADGARVRVRLDDGPPENGCRPSADPLLRSLAEVYGPTALALVLTGMGHDALAGCQRVRARDGRVLVQDRESSVVWGMPGVVAAAGLAEAVLPLDQIAGELNRRARSSGAPRAAA